MKAATTRTSPVSVVAASHRHRSRRLSVLAALVLLALAGTGIFLSPKGLGIGTGSLYAAFLDGIPVARAIPHPAPDPAAVSIVWEVRVPRVIAAIAIGAQLALAGVAFQGLLMNPLAEPYTVGVSAGAAVGAAIAEVTGFSALLLGFAGTAAAFAAGLAAIVLVYALARVQGRVAVHSFLLAGVVVGTLLWSAIPLMLFLAGKSDQMTRVMYFIIGSLSAVDWTHAILLLPFLLLTWTAMRHSAWELNLMAMGEETAAHLGVETEAFKRRVLVVGALATAASVSVAGIIAFVGLVVPHFARKLIGPDHRAMLPIAAILGASLLVAADTLARVFLDEMPVGVITSLIGAPVFCLLLRRRAGAW